MKFCFNYCSENYFHHTKRFLVLLLLTVFSLAGYTQPKGVTISVDLTNKTLDQIFKTLEKKSGFRFGYSQEILIDKRTFNLKHTATDLEVILEKLGHKAGFKYRLANGKVSIQPIGKKGIKGKVTDKATGEFLPGVSVRIKGTTQGTVTDFDGNFSLNAYPNATLQFSFIGYENQIIEVGGQTHIDVALNTATTDIGEITVTALGFVAERDKIGYASSGIVGNSIEKSPERNVINGLAGKASGLRISRSSGDPGAGSHIQVRGASSLTRDVQPLIILDGVPISNSTVNSSFEGAAVRGTVQQSRLNDLNPNDIESIEVLKGASAAALWGTRAANGVLVIKTKNGKEEEEKLNISYTTTTSLEKINARYELQDKFGQGIGGVFIENNPRSWGDKISDRKGGTDVFDKSGSYFIAKDRDIYYPIIEKNSQQTFLDENFDAAIGTGFTWENNIRVSGKNNGTNYLVSLGNLDQKGIIRNSSTYNRTTFRVNAEKRFNQYVTIKTHNAYIRSVSERTQRGSNTGGLYLGLLRTPADFDNRDYEGDFYESGNASPVPNSHRSYRNSIGKSSNPGYNNPLWTINNEFFTTTVDRFINSAELFVEPNKWLDILTRAGLDKYDDRRVEFFPENSLTGNSAIGLFKDEIITENQFNADMIIRATPKIGTVWSSDLLLGFNYNNRKFVRVGAELFDYILPVKLLDFSNATGENTVAIDEEYTIRTNAGYYSLGMGYKNTLFVTTTGRFEAASTFGEGSTRTFFYPSTNFAWQFSDLFKGKKKTFSFGKFRAAYGLVGIQPEPYRSSNTYVTAQYVNTLGSFGYLNASSFGNGGFVRNSTLGDSSLKPETKKEFEFGWDLRFFDNQLSLSATYYENETNDALFSLEIPASTGYSDIYTNAGTIENEGYEVDLSYDPTMRNNNWDIAFNLGWFSNKNTVTDLKNAESVPLPNQYTIGQKAIEGEALGVLWGRKWERNENGGLALDENGFPQLASERGIIGDPNPDWQGSAGIMISYKGLTLNALFETFQGADIVGATRGALLNFGTLKESANEVTASTDLIAINGNIIASGETFRGNIGNFGAGPVALEESWYRSLGGIFNGSPEQFVEDGSWTRLRELSLSYTFSNNFFRRKLKIQSFNLSLSGRNLVLWTDYEGNDPDTSLNGVGTARGIDYFNNPGTKSYAFTLSVNY